MKTNINKWISAEEGLEEFCYMDDVWGWSEKNGVMRWMRSGGCYISYTAGNSSRDWDLSNQPTHVILIERMAKNQVLPKPKPPIVS